MFWKVWGRSWKVVWGFLPFTSLNSFPILPTVVTIWLTKHHFNYLTKRTNFFSTVLIFGPYFDWTGKQIWICIAFFGELVENDWCEKNWNVFNICFNSSATSCVIKIGWFIKAFIGSWDLSFKFFHSEQQKQNIIQWTKKFFQFFFDHTQRIFAIPIIGFFNGNCVVLIAIMLTVFPFVAGQSLKLSWLVKSKILSS